MLTNGNKELQLKVSLKLHRCNESLSKLCYKNCFIICGGGTKGIYSIGVLKYLFDASSECPFRLNNIDIFAGTSVGSYLATALSLGFNKDDILSLTESLDLDKLLKDKYTYLRCFARLFYSYYFFDDTGRRDIVKSIMEKKSTQIKQHLGSDIDHVDLTFGHLKKLIEKYPKIYKDLLINTVDISNGEELFLTTLDDKFCNIKIFDALLASSAIPFIFAPLKLYMDDEGNYRYSSELDQSKKYTDHYLVDGGICNNTPLNYFLLNPKICANCDLWLLKFTTEISYYPITNLYSLIKCVIYYVLSRKNDIDLDLIQKQYSLNIINLKLNVGTFDIYSKEEISMIIDNIYLKCLDRELSFEKA